MFRKLYMFFSDQRIKAIQPICYKHIVGTISALYADRHYCRQREVYYIICGLIEISPTIRTVRWCTIKVI